jgi:ATP-dependent DNA helicase MPH1
MGMFLTSLHDIAGGKSAAGKKAGTTGSAQSIKNNFEFQKLVRDVEAEMNCIQKGMQGRSLADKHPKMGKTLELVSWTGRGPFRVDKDKAS